MKHLILLTALSLFISTIAFAQRGKDGDITISSSSIVNEYTTLSSNVSAGSTSLSVASSSLNSNGRFTSGLSSGDLVVIIQMYGVSIDQSSPDLNWGSITAYNNCGNYEYAEVSSVPNGTTINLRCGLKNSYTSSQRVQVIRVPRYNSLIVNAQITAPAWNGSTGGIVIIESLGDILLNSAGSINVDALGFRGALAATSNSVWGGWNINTNTVIEGALKGESVFGYTAEYTAANGTRARGALANGGGGGNGHNAGGGGGANGGDPSNWFNGIGVPNSSYNVAWALESPNISGMVTSGGGKGGYSYSGLASNPLTTAPGNSSWGSDLRRIVGGSGGHALDYSSGKIFMAGGGGAGDRNDSYNTGGSGGNGGGMVLIKCYGQLTGSGIILANGAAGTNTTSTSPPFGSFAGNDGSGGGGAGGTILLDVNGSINGITCNANGGKGGDQILVSHAFFFGTINEAEGPGGGGSGGYISYPSGNTFTVNVNGGVNGTSNSATLTSFPPNGATSGGVGTVDNSSLTSFSIQADNDTICAGNSTTLTASVIGSLPSGTNLIWYDAAINGNFIGFGTNFTTANLFNDTTFYVGTCPGTYTIPVSVIMGSSFSYSDVSVAISDENCGQSDGSITGITISGGAQPLQYEWNSVLTADQDLTNAAAGTYTLVVTDNNGCAGTIGTYTIGENTGPTLDESNVVITDDHCSQGIGSITGLVASGQQPLSYSWNGATASSNADLTGVIASSNTLVVTDTYGCSTASLAYDVMDISGPSIDTSGIFITDETCSSSNGSISGIQVSSNSSYTIVWNGSSQTTLDLQNLDSGTYDITVTDAFGCVDNSGSILVSETGFPTANFEIISSPAFTGDTIYFNNTSSTDVITWNYIFSDGTEITDSSTYHIYYERGNYEVCLIVSNAAGCSDTLCQNVIINPIISAFEVPNVFTPNGDGLNEIFAIDGLTEEYNLQIFNRWGEVIYQEAPYSNSWDGRNSSGKKVPEGTYYYILSPYSNTSLDTYTGYFMILR